MHTRKAIISLFMATLAFTVSFAIWSLLSPLASQFQKLYHIGDFAISVLIAVPVILGSLARIPMGVLTDRYGGRRVMTLLLLFTIIPCVGLYFARSYWTFLFWAFFLGMAGSSFAVGVPYVSRWFSAEKQGLVLGIFGVGNIGTAISARFVPQLANKLGGWPPVFLIFAGMVLLVALAFYFISSDEARPVATKTLNQRLVILKREKLSWLFSLFYFVTFGGFVAFGLYLPKLLVDLYGLDKVDAGNRAAVFIVVATLARPLGGWLSDKLGAMRILTGVFTLTPLLALILAFSPGVVILTICFLTIAFCLGLANGAVFKLVPQYFLQEAGTVTGLVGAAGGLGGFFPPLIMGFFKSTLGSYAFGYVLLALTAVVCLILNLVVLGKRSKEEAVTNEPALSR